jgi:hypothetical protein
MYNPKALKKYLKENPDTPIADAALMFECSRQDVYNARFNVGIAKYTPILRKPRGKRTSTPVAAEPVAVEIDERDARIAELTAQIEKLKISPNAKNIEVESEWKRKYDVATHHIAELSGVLDKLEKQIIGYKAVINYLEHQLATTHGTPV